jgi:hypothetical protein
MKNILEKYQPLVQLETWGEQLIEMYRFFKDLGYQAYFLENNRLQPLKTRKRNDGEKVIFYLCLPESRKE